MNYTKGEWNVTRNNLSKVTLPSKLTVRSNTGCPIAILTDSERSIADAHLIAAAPDLYEACKGLEKVFELTKANSQWRSSYADQKVEAMEQALAKAEGMGE